jgi:hypothetical protein
LPPRNFKGYRESLSDQERQKLDHIIKLELSVQSDIIDQNIKRDREHLRLVNFCVDPFRYMGSLHKETQYLFIRVEPLYSLAIKSFDCAIFNQSQRVLMLVECKSSVSDADGEVESVNQAILEAGTHKKELEDTVGDTINMIENVICTNAAYSSKVKSAILKRNLPICLWSADQASSILLLEKQGEDTSTEVSGGRLHHDSKLTRLLMGGVKSGGPVRSVSFLPSSHPCTILEEILPMLNVELEKTGATHFGLSDVSKLLNNESSPLLYNFSDPELWKFAGHIVEVAQEAEIFRDVKSTSSDLETKQFELAVKKATVKSMIEDVREKYVEYHAARKSEEKALEKFEVDRSKLIRKLEDFSGTTGSTN